MFFYLERGFLSMMVETQDGVRLHVNCRGNGVPCLFLHGGPGYWSYSFEHFAGHLFENDFEMVYLDQRGCGRSNHANQNDYSLDRLILDLEDVRRRLGIDEWVVMGHSFGGTLAVHYAYRFPERVKGLILSNCTVNLLESLSYQIQKGAELLRQDIQVPVDKEEVFEIFSNTSAQLRDRNIYGIMQFQDDQEWASKLATVDYRLEGDPTFTYSILTQEDFCMDVSHYTKYIDAPTLVISGREDHLIGPEHYQCFQFPNQTVEVLEGKHHPYLENQAAFYEVIRSFLNEVPTEPITI